MFFIRLIVSGVVITGLTPLLGGDPGNPPQLHGYIIHPPHGCIILRYDNYVNLHQGKLQGRHSLKDHHFSTTMMDARMIRKLSVKESLDHCISSKIKGKKEGIWWMAFLTSMDETSERGNVYV
jgi:hypothetical protein